MAAVPGYKFGLKICEQLGLDPSSVRRIEIVFDVKDVVHVVVTGFVDEAAAALAEETVTRYRLVRDPE